LQVANFEWKEAYMGIQYNRNLSIIIPHYNTPDLLEKLINSIPHKIDIQIIVIDDNSNQQLDILHAIQNKYDNYVEFYKNTSSKKGAGACRNIGLKHADGKWILFADADDFYLDGMYDKICPFFETDYDEVFFTPTSIYLDTGAIANRHCDMKMHIDNYITNPTRANLLKLKISLSTPCSKLINHQLINKYNIVFDEVLYFNDMMFSVKTGHYSKKITAVKDVIYCITRNKGSMTTNVSWEAYEIRLKEYLKVCKFVKTHYSMRDVKIMHYTSLGMLYRAFQQHYGIKKYIYILNLFYRNRIPLFTWNQLKITSLHQAVSGIRSKHLDSRYYTGNKKAHTVNLE